MKILVVDDHDLFRRAMLRYLDHQGHAREGAEDAAEALTLFRESLQGRPFDMVIIDIAIGEAGGFNLAQHILFEHEHAGRTPRIVFMSALPDDRAARRSRDFGIEVMDKMDMLEFVKSLEANNSLEKGN